MVQPHLEVLAVNMRHPTLAFAAALTVAATAALLPLPVHAQDAATLRQKHETLRERLAKNPFGRPLALESTQTSGSLRGDVYAVVDHPYATVEQALKSRDNWCDILILHLNVKRCLAVDDRGERKLALEVGRKFDQPLDQAHRLLFAYRVGPAQPDYLNVKLSADSGPFGTSDYRIEVEVTPVDAKRSLVHMSYAYAYGLAARLAINTYLGTLGRDKVGFTPTGTGKDGQPEFVGGTVGLLERNTMRYYLAIDAYLSAQALPPAERVERRIRTWYASTERYARQLHEMEEADYLEMKRKEIRRQAGGG